jgi:hypothetical protein
VAIEDNPVFCIRHRVIWCAHQRPSTIVGFVCATERLGMHHQQPPTVQTGAAILAPECLGFAYILHAGITDLDGTWMEQSRPLRAMAWPYTSASSCTCNPTHTTPAALSPRTPLTDSQLSCPCGQTKR